MHWYLEAWKNFSDFNGRASPQAYWTATLIHILITLGIILLFFITVINNAATDEAAELALDNFSLIYTLATFLPFLSLAVRRLHDVGKSGWTVLLNAIPFIGPLIVIYFLAQRGQSGENQYGSNPVEQPLAGWGSADGTYEPEEPERKWECPRCQFSNPNTTFECMNCQYKLN